MARGTDFGGIHSHRDLHLIQQSVEVSPAEPKTNFKDIPGADGSKDLTTQPSGWVVYYPRSIRWTFALYPGDNWEAKQRQVSNALNGRRCHIYLHGDPDYYYDGRLVVKEYASSGRLKQIIVEATCSPYLLKREETTVTANLSTAYTEISLPNDFKRVIPTITVTADTQLLWKGNSFAISAGTYRIADIQLQAGENTLQAKVSSGTGTISVVYQEGSL